MKDYARIAAKMRETPWLITESGLALICDIMNARMSGAKLTDEEIAIRLEEVGNHGSDVGPNGNVSNGIGVLPIYGPIFGKANMMTEMSGATSLEAFRKDFAAMVADPSIKSIILDIDSPGGTSEMVQTTGDEIFAARDTKPVVALANNMAGSAAYWLGSQASEFYVTPDGMVGSVGAYTVHEDHSVQDAQRGVKFTYISAGPYKTEGNPHEPLSREGEDYRQEMIDELYDQFTNNVARGRGVTNEKVVADFGGGRMLSANKGIIKNMVDGTREFDAVVEQLATPAPFQVSFVDADMKRHTGMLTLGADGNLHLESAEWEHSEPGSGQPPTPRLPDHTEPDIASGSRRPDITPGIPDEAQEPGAPKASNSFGGNMDLNELMALYEVDSEEALFAAITAEHAEVTALRADVGTAAQEREFSKTYPAVWAQMQEDRKVNLENAADKFVDSHGMFFKTEGDKTIRTNFGLSAIARDTVRETYMAFAQGKGGLAQFDAAMTAISHNGVVEYGERGSSVKDEDELDFNTTTAEGIQNARKLFAAKVDEIMVEDKLDRSAAMVEAAKRYPDLASAYRATAAA